MTRTINCGRLDHLVGFSKIKAAEERIRRIYSVTAGELINPNYYPISTNGSQIMHSGGLADLDYFIEHLSDYKNNTLIVLTVKEYSLLYDRVKECRINLRVLEEDYPIFASIKLTDSLLVNFQILKKLLAKVNFLGIKGGSFFRDQVTRHLNKIARKLRFKNSTDHQFFFAFNEGYREVFKLKEERSDRVVVALDFNSMYASCLDGKFPDPRSIKYKFFEPACTDTESIDEGVYLVTLHNAKDTFFLETHPFLYKRLGKSYRFSLKIDDCIKVVLFKNEIIYYSKFFQSIEIHEGYCTSKSIQHPLLNTSVEYYAKRCHSKLVNDAVMEVFYKTSLQLMHSSTNQKTYKIKIFNSFDDIKNFLFLNFNVDLLSATDYQISTFFSRNKYFKIRSFENKFELTYLNIKSDDQLFSLSAQIVAEARLKLMKAIERLLEDGTTELCYVNIDSLHVSVLKSKIDDFFLRHKDFISSEMGCLKIQAIADKGYWFDVGRYWLKTNEQVIQFKNIGFNSKYAKTKFVKFRILPVFVRGTTFDYIHHIFNRIENSFGYGKRIKIADCTALINFDRYDFSEVSSLEKANMTIFNEILMSKKIKVDLFNNISC